MAAPISAAIAHRGSGGESRADPMTATVSSDGALPGSTAGDESADHESAGDESAGDELVATHALLSGHRDDGAAQDALGVLTTRIDRQGPADPSLAA